MTTQLSGAATLIVDSNLFLECRLLDKIPWEELGFAEVSLVVTRPVQQELDNNKKNQKGRTFKKALVATKLLRELVTGGGDHLVIREAAPRVTLALMAASRIEPELAPALDPGFNDDAIILRMLQVQRDHPGLDVRLLTHDTGPMATAKSLSVPFIPIPDGWLLDEQDDAATKENRKLQAEVKRLQSQEPVFSLSACDGSGSEIDRLDTKLDHYDALDDDQIEMLMGELKQQYPLVTDFGSAETTPKPSSPPAVGRITVTEFHPATEVQIEEYREKYPAWLEDCRAFFEKLDRALNFQVPKPLITFQAINTGTRPAAQSLVRFVGLGGIVIFPAKKEKVDDSPETPNPLRMPSPPKPPQGRWVKKPGIQAGAMSDWMTRHFEPFGTMHRDSRFDIPDLVPRMPPPQDPDRFYWKGGRPVTPCTTVELTCTNWRHSVGPQTFEFQVHRASVGDTSGAIRFEIHADNLSDPVQKTVPVTVKLKPQPTIDRARDFIDPMRLLGIKVKTKGKAGEQG